jgi:GntR family transcriptional regulator/MocR family aminotransferase
MTEGLDLHLGVDKAAGFVGRALEAALREAIRSGRLHPGARLPGSRSLAADLGISRGTVVQAYAQLIAEGWLTGTTGSGTRVADLPGPGPAGGSAPAAGAGDDPAPATARLAVDLRPGRPDLSSFPRTDWASSVRRALSAAPYEDLDYAEPAGLPVLRAAVAGYVTRARGVRADADAVVITAGFTPGLALLGRVLGRLGIRTVATENPGLGPHRDVLHAAGLATVPLEVGPGGADPGGLAPGWLAGRAVVLTPAHQYPRGVVLGPGTVRPSWPGRGGAARAAAGGFGRAGAGPDRPGTARRGRPARTARPRLLAGARRGPARRADPRVRHSPAARLVPGTGGASRSGTRNLSLSGLSCWTGRCLGLLV